MKGALHPIQVKILKFLYNNPMGIYKISEVIGLPTPKVQFHVNQLFKKGLLKRKKRLYKNRESYIYRVNRQKVRIENEKDKVFIYLKIEG